MLKQALDQLKAKKSIKSLENVCKPEDKQVIRPAAKDKQTSDFDSAPDSDSDSDFEFPPKSASLLFDYRLTRSLTQADNSSGRSTPSNPIAVPFSPHSWKSQKPEISYLPDFSLLSSPKELKKRQLSEASRQHLTKSLSVQNNKALLDNDIPNDMPNDASNHSDDDLDCFFLEEHCILGKSPSSPR